jgi:hypothetical protein
VQRTSVPDAEVARTMALAVRQVVRDRAHDRAGVDRPAPVIAAQRRMNQSLVRLQEDDGRRCAMHRMAQRARRERLRLDCLGGEPEICLVELRGLPRRPRPSRCRPGGRD